LVIGNFFRDICIKIVGVELLENEVQKDGQANGQSGYNLQVFFYFR